MKKNKLFKVDGYQIPIDLVMLTGGGTDDWETISQYHVEMYRKYTPLSPDDFVLEVGSGVGRDAIQLTKILSDKGKYVGFDIIKPSIEWSQKNITKKHKNFKFFYYDINSQIHNSGGTIKTTDIKLPAKDGTVDRIFLHSVFTHMFEKDIVHYLKEFKRVLKPDGLVLASFFVIDDLALDSLRKGKSKGHRHALSFQHKRGKSCYVNDKDYPEGAVGYTPRKIRSMLKRAGLGLHGNFVHRGVWSGMRGSNGQDILILEKLSRAESLVQNSKRLKFTER
ncbi:MAG: class I SAM-dependent methyltransferase [Candidatus Saccharimonadales bacterium]